MSGIFIILFLILSVINLASSVELVASILGILLIVFLYFASGFLGSLIRAYSSSNKKSKVSVTDFFYYAKSNGTTFFNITILKLLTIAILVVPLIAIYYFYLLKNPIKYSEYLLGLIALFDIFIVELLFFPAYFSAALCNTGAFKSIMISFSFFRKKHVYAFGLFVLFSINFPFTIFPVLNLVPLFVVFPIIYFAMISMFQSNLPSGSFSD